MSTKTLDDLLKGGGKSFFNKDSRPGDSVTGTLVSDPEIRQYTNYTSGEPEFWDNGEPKLQAVISLQTTIRENEDDDGIRAVYIKMWGEGKKALVAASREAGGSPKKGDTFKATYVGEGEAKVKGFPPKIYKYEIKKNSALDAALGVSPEATSTTPAANPGVDPGKAAQIAKLIALGLEDDKIAAALDGVTAQEAATVRLQAAAASSQGF